MPVLLDHYQSEQLGWYWRHYPEIGLDEGIFYNLLLYDHLLVSSDAIYPSETSDGKWGKEFERFLEIGKIKVVKSTDIGSVERTIDVLFSGKLQNVSLPDFEDVLNYNYCQENDIPLCISKRRLHNIAEIAAKSQFAFGTHRTNEDVIEAPNRRSLIAEWLIELEMPALNIRSERQRERLSPNMPQLLTHLIFISPNELCQTFEEESQIENVQKFLFDICFKVATRSELADSVSMIRESLDAKLGKSDIGFAAANIGLSWVPFSGAALTPAQLALNRYIKKETNWLVFLNSVNRKIRNVQYHKNA